MDDMQVVAPQRCVLITGATGGIGLATAEALLRQGHRVVVTGRDRTRARDAVASLRASTGSGSVDAVLGDLASVQGVRDLAGEVGALGHRIDVLVNNAGVAPAERQLNSDGIELNLAVNVVAPLLLTRLLWPQLALSPVGGRVVTVTGGAHPRQLDLDDLGAVRSFAGLTTYSNSKLMMMAVMRELAARTVDSGVTVNVCYPGRASTAMTQGVTREMLPRAMRFAWPLFRRMVRPDGGASVAKAARSSTYLAASAAVDGLTGTYWSADVRQVPWPAAIDDPATWRRAFEQVDDLAAT